MTDTLTDYITGKTIPDIGAEANRQKMEKILVDEKGFEKSHILVDSPIVLEMGQTVYQSKIDLIVRAGGQDYMAIKCAPGSLGSREREILSAARLFGSYTLPVCAVSDGRTAIVMDTLTGKKIGEGLSFIPTREAAEKAMAGYEKVSISNAQREKEKLIFRSYDSMNVNRS